MSKVKYNNVLISEFILNKCCFLIWPYNEKIWGNILWKVQREFIEFCFLISSYDSVKKKYLGEFINVCIFNEKAKKEAQKALGSIPVVFHIICYDDIWLRDTGPVFVRNIKGKIQSLEFFFNGWGQKFFFLCDNKMPNNFNKIIYLKSKKINYVLEEGTVTNDGQGLLAVNKCCLLNKNRNSFILKRQVNVLFQNIFSYKKIIWVKHCLKNDHTDGHIDTLVRFILPRHIICMKSYEKNDPNKVVLNFIIEKILNAKDVFGMILRLKILPSPGLTISFNKNILPATYINFYIGNKTVVIPVFSSKYDFKAVKLISKVFPNRRVVGSSAKFILEGGGGFHCITKQLPMDSLL